MNFETKKYGKVYVSLGLYSQGGGKAITLMSPGGLVIAKLTVNIPDESGRLQPGEFFVKTWSENELIGADALPSGLFVDTGRRVPTGHVEAQIWKLSEREEE